ncbi:hypothetical protein CLOM621_07124 [Clostridium sp. M62/1]|nr:hypothetical protein CLOM621_07124 [Clostridium sp. M62/1]CBK76093.1 hypothetical protein CLS_02240 [[Clostridium] cf. saccharolyticum K10]
MTDTRAGHSCFFLQEAEKQGRIYCSGRGGDVSVRFIFRKTVEKREFYLKIITITV